ncbi:MAG: pyruvate ferredoxin oxidoreductase [Peptococcaceae bacterium]|jgi:pyruvate ferredoxin oxidoreductase delta subunit|nr:pyruvate ferredoxin oxidoreductase [Peptococcaceae bacterium]
MPKPQITSFAFPSRKEGMPLGPSAVAGVLVETNAGWRTFRPVINGEKCTKCQRCWLLCPDGVIERGEPYFQIDYNFCKGCGLCAYECPVKAITMVKEGDSNG